MRTSTKGRKFPAAALRRDEVLAVLGELGDEDPVSVRNRTLVVTLWRAGPRVSEAAALRPSDFDPDAMTLRILRGKGGKARTVGVDAGTVQNIQEWLQLRAARWNVADDAPIFCTKRGDPVRTTYVRAMLSRAARAAGISRRVHPHAFRHTFAVELAREGVPAVMIQRLLGHSSISTTTTYLSSLSPEEALGYIRGREW